jgi:hypothetical protein
MSLCRLTRCRWGFCGSGVQVATNVGWWWCGSSWCFDGGSLRRAASKSSSIKLGWCSLDQSDVVDLLLLSVHHGGGEGEDRRSTTVLCKYVDWEELKRSTSSGPCFGLGLACADLLAEGRPCQDLVLEAVWRVFV